LGAQNVLPTRIHHGNMFVSGEAWHLFKEAHPEQDFSDFWLEVSLKFSMGCFDLSLFFLLREDEGPTATNSSSSKLMKTEPLAPSLLVLTSLTLVMLQRIVVANQGMLLNFHSRVCNSQCNLDDTRSRFLCK
jgi:hypothetical protein